MVRNTHLLEKVLDPNDVLTVIDGGSRNGLKDIVALHPCSCIYGFEPNAVEAGRVGHVTTSIVPHFPRRGEIATYPYAIGAETGNTTLNISLRPGASSILDPNRELLDRFQADHWSEMKEITERINVPIVSMSDFLAQTSLQYVDFLKLDTQGNEADILESFGDRLNNVGVIKTEVEFVELYRDQRLFHEITKYLHERGFELIDITWSPACRRFHALNGLSPSSYRLIWGDAIYARKPYDTEKPRSLHQALVLGALGYIDLSIYLLHQISGISSERLSNAEAFVMSLASPRTLRQKLKRFVEKLLGLQLSRYNWSRGQQVKSMRSA